MTDFAERIQGCTFRFFGVCGNYFKIGDEVWEAVCDDDHLRSDLSEVRLITDEYTVTHLTFFREPIARVCIYAFDDADLPYDEERRHYYLSMGYELIDADDGHRWLEFGTEDYEDYYPSFFFTYEPKEPKE